MKPLLIAPRLPEDHNVWLFNERRSDALHSALWGQSHAADRRDAELMLKLLHGAPDRGRRRRARAWQGWASAPQGYRVPL